MPIDRLILIVMDSAGVGEMPDAAEYGDQGSDTLGHIGAAAGGIQLPYFQKLGLGNLHKIPGVDPAAAPLASYGKMAEQSAGKDTTTGHWEMAGLIVTEAFPTYPGGFPPEVLEPFEAAIGKKVLGNKAASGTEIIKELGEDHMRTGRPIVYTSADSVFQIACHEETFGLDELYRICEIARRQLRGKHNMSRVIARPFVGGSPADFTRTPHRRDFSVDPLGQTLLDWAKAAGYEVNGVGKIWDIFNGHGVTSSRHIDDNKDGMEQTLELVKTAGPGIIFTNLVDFDMKYGHRNDAAGYANALREFDAFLPKITGAMRPNDVMMITADHGCDPTDVSTDHTREYVPILVYGKSLKPGVNLGTRATFSDLAATAVDLMGLGTPVPGTSFASQILN